MNGKEEEGGRKKGRQGKRTDGVFLCWWEGEVTFGEAGSVGFVLGDEVFLDGGCHCGAWLNVCGGEFLVYLFQAGAVLRSL